MNVIKKNKDGFSLVELLVVMFIIAILTGVLLPNLMGARQKAKDAQKISDVNAVKDALRMYYNDNQSYPASMPAFISVMPTYMPGLGFTGDVYTVSPDRDKFTITFELETATGDEDEASQSKCGLAPIDGEYAVCAN